MVDNIVDTTYKQDIQKFREAFFQKIKDTLRNIPGLINVKVDSLSNCIIRRLDGNLTIKEFFAEYYLNVEKLKSVFSNCFGQVSKKK